MSGRCRQDFFAADPALHEPVHQNCQEAQAGNASTQPQRIFDSLGIEARRPLRRRVGRVRTHARQAEKQRDRNADTRLWKPLRQNGEQRHEQAGLGHAEQHAAQSNDHEVGAAGGHRRADEACRGRPQRHAGSGVAVDSPARYQRKEDIGQAEHRVQGADFSMGKIAFGAQTLHQRRHHVVFVVVPRDGERGKRQHQPTPRGQFREHIVHGVCNLGRMGPRGVSEYALSAGPVPPVPCGCPHSGTSRPSAATPPLPHQRPARRRRNTSCCVPQRGRSCHRQWRAQ